MMRLVPGAMKCPLAVSLLIGLLVGLGVVGIRASGSLETLELAAYDWYLRLAPKTESAGSRIVLIGMTEGDIRREGRWPLSDATLAGTLSKIVEHKPLAIGLDVYRDVTVPPGGEALNAVLAENDNIVAAMKVGDRISKGVPAPAALRGTERVGFNDILVDPGGIVRRGLLFIDAGNDVVPSFALKLALLYLEPKGIVPQPDPLTPEYMRLGGTTIPPFEADDGGYVGADARGYQFLMDFRDAHDAFPTYSLTDVLSGRVDWQIFEHKVVLVGVTAESVKDMFYAPQSRDFRTSQQISGIDLHARMVSQLVRTALDGDPPILSLSEKYEWAWILIWSLVGAAVGLWSRSPLRFALVAVGGPLLIFVSTYVAFLQGWWLPVLPPAFGWLVSATVVTAHASQQEKQQRALLMHLFSRFVAPEVAEAIWEQREQFWDGGRPRSQRLIATVLFTDLKGFTTMSEKLDPDALIDWLNHYMETMARLVMFHGGVIDDYAGDGFKADFGVPLPRASEEEIRRDALNAVECALAMEARLIELNRVWHEQRLPTTQMRIGICTGPVIAGSLGSSERLKYTTVGDTVNTASRLESFFTGPADDRSKDGLCRILVSETTLAYLGNNFECEKLGEFKLKGKEEPVAIYRLLGPSKANSRVERQTTGT